MNHLISALEQIATGKITGEETNYKDTVVVMREIAKEALSHPVKQLSDEEIEEIIRKHWNREYGNRNMMTFARAIIKEITE